MSVRNLTKRFIDIRNAAKANRSLLKGDNDSGDSDSGLLNVSYDGRLEAMYVL